MDPLEATQSWIAIAGYSLGSPAMCVAASAPANTTQAANKPCFCPTLFAASVLPMLRVILNRCIHSSPLQTVQKSRRLQQKVAGAVATMRAHAAAAKVPAPARNPGTTRAPYVTADACMNAISADDRAVTNMLETRTELMPVCLCWSSAVFVACRRAVAQQAEAGGHTYTTLHPDRNGYL